MYFRQLHFKDIVYSNLKINCFFYIFLMGKKNISQVSTHVLQKKNSCFVKFTAGFNCSHVNLNSCEHCQQNNYSKPSETVKKKKKILLITPNPAFHHISTRLQNH